MGSELGGLMKNGGPVASGRAVITHLPHPINMVVPKENCCSLTLYSSRSTDAVRFDVACCLFRYRKPNFILPVHATHCEHCREACADLFAQLS
jgi:hypothetical protein